MRCLPLVLSTFPHSQTGSFPTFAYTHTMLSVDVCGCTVIVCGVYLQVKGVMRDNLSKVVDRGERLDDLEQRAGQSMSVEPASGLLALYVCIYSMYVNVCTYV